jgi:hypothetical protein
MIEVYNWIRRHVGYPHEPKPRNILVTYDNLTKVRWRTRAEAQDMIANGTANFVTPQRGETVRYTEPTPNYEDVEIDE